MALIWHQLWSFEEVCCGFEFNVNYPGLYPSPTLTGLLGSQFHFSIMSISSYGRVPNAGSSDSFDYELPNLQERPSCYLDVLFPEPILNHQPCRHIDSDASSFYFQAPAHQAGGQSSASSHHHHELNLSISSQGPPISHYNCSYGTHHRCNDSNSSASSVAISYAMHGAIGCTAWARHHPELIG